MSLRVIELLKKRGSYSAVFKAVKQKLLCLKFHLEASCKSNREIATRKKDQSWAKHLLLVLELRKKRVPIQLF
jgi:hypothetical protein